MMKKLFLRLLGIASNILFPVPAAAHPRLVASSPVAGGSVLAPTTINTKG